MSCYIVLDLLTRRREDALKIYERANELLKELNTEESKKIKFNFYDSSSDGEYGFFFDSWNGDLCCIAFDIITDVVALFPEMLLHFVESMEGPVTREGFSENGKLYEMDAPKDENGRYLLDDCESVVYIYPLELLPEALNESRYTTYNLCHRLLWLKVNTPDDAKAYVPEETSNEQSVNVGDIARKLFGDIKEAHAEKSDGGADFTAMENQTRQWMNEGAEDICKASFMYKGNYCAVDILRKNGDRWDIYKVQPEFAGEGTNPEVFAPSLAYQKWVLTQCGVKVGNAYLIGEQQGESDSQRPIVDMNALVETEYPKVEKQVWLALQYLRDRRNGPFNNLPDPCLEGCPFMEYCKQNVKRYPCQTDEDYVPSEYDENNVLEIRNHVLVNCRSDFKGDLVIPCTVSEIGDFAFYGFTGITSVIIPDSVTRIAHEAFKGCSGLTSIVIPDSVTEIGAGAFADCSGLISVAVSQGNVTYDSRDNCNAIIETATNSLICGCQNTIIPDSVKAIGDSAFNCCQNLTEITIPDSVERFDELAFYRCESLKNIVIPDSVTEIGECAFDGCEGLVSLVIGKAVTKIDQSAFEDCCGLTSIVIPDSVKIIDELAFRGCSGLTSLVVSDYVTEIGNGAFSDCSGLTSITVSQGNSIYDSRDNCNAIIETATNRLICGCKNTIIPDSVTEIGDWSFRCCNSLTSIAIPDSVEKISANAFLGCTGLTSVVIPDSVTEICFGAFEGCSSLNSVVIPNSVEIIKSSVFYDCSNLRSIVIPNSIERIDSGVFCGCANLTSINIPDSLTSIADGAFYGCDNLPEETKEKIRKINKKAF